jgi:hypothetical protein
MAEQDRDRDYSLDEFTGDVSKDIVDDDVKDVFNETTQINYGAEKQAELLRDYEDDESPKLSGGDIDADWRRADHVGEEAVGGTVPTPEQNVVDELGQAVGLTYSDDEPLNTEEKIAQRDRERMEFDPVTSEDYEERLREEFDEPLNPEARS